MNDTMIDAAFTKELKRAVEIAQAIAREYMNPHFSPAHLLKALMHKDAGLYPTLKIAGKDVYYIEEWAEVRIEPAPKSKSLPEIISGDEKIAEVINEADNIRLKLSKEEVGTLEILAAICTPGIAFTYDQLKTLTLHRDELVNTSLADQELMTALNDNGAAQNGKPADKGSHALLKYCIDKTLLAKEGKMDAIVGRDKEIRMMSEILCRRSKPNVLIAGEPGVGKSALADGFTLAIVEQKVPQHLLNARVFELDSGALIAGASYKGEVEDRLKNIIKEIKQFDKAILFIDEIHALLEKNGSAAGAANLLKPELARGELTVIGATTMDEYRKLIEPDEAFNRRFELLQVEEPDAQVSFFMLQKVIPYYEKHHEILVPEETIHETIRLAKRYIKDRRLPDAALDLADRSMAALRLIQDTGNRELQEFQQQFEELIKPEEQNIKTIEDWKWLYTQMKNKISPILWGYYQSEEDPEKMTEADGVKNYIQKALTALLKASETKHTTLQKNDVAAIVSHKTGIPIGKVQTQEKERLLKMEDMLRMRLVGQDQAIHSVAESILESRSGLSKPGQPIGSFFFLGPTGTGKTELAKALAEFLFQDESFMIRFDMSEFKEEHAAALLYGAPPGYVGYEEGGLLVNKIREKPFSVVLFDEIEKAHTSVFDVFLQIMDEGKLHDKLGKEGDFSNSLVIFTSNVGSKYVVDEFNKGKVPEAAKMMELMGQHFRPEFLGRLTEIAPFAPMTEEMVKNILNIQMKSLYTALEKQNIRLILTDSASAQLAKQGFNPQYGARPLAGVIRNQVRRPLSRKIISGDLLPGNSITLDAKKDGTLVWKKISK